MSEHSFSVGEGGGEGPYDKALGSVFSIPFLIIKSTDVYCI